MKNKITFSLLFLFLICLTNAINIATDGLLLDFVAMHTTKFFSEIELWRILLFPFVSASLEGFIIFLFAFAFLSNDLEKFLGGKIYPTFIILITFLTGTATAIITYGQNISFSGLEGTSFFVITFFAILQKKNFIKKKNLYQRISVISIVSLWIAIKLYIGIENGFTNVVPSYIMAGSGVIIGFLLFFQINYLVKKRIKQNKIKGFSQHYDANFVGYSIYNNPQFKKYIYNKIEESYLLQIKEKIKSKTDAALLFNTEILTDEEKLDQVLDKINEVGKSNLTKEELEFLNYYSDKLQ